MGAMSGQPVGVGSPSSLWSSGLTTNICTLTILSPFTCNSDSTHTVNMRCVRSPPQIWSPMVIQNASQVAHSSHSCSFIVVVNSGSGCGISRGANGEGAPSGGRGGGGVIALSSLSPGGPDWENFKRGLALDWGHCHTNTQVTAHRRSGRLGAILHFESGASWFSPSN